MNKDALNTQIRSMIDENPVSVTFGTESHDCAEVNMHISEMQANVGKFESYRKSVYLIKEDWTTLPEKRNKITIGSTTFRVILIKDFYLDTVRRLDLGDEYELGGD